MLSFNFNKEPGDRVSLLCLGAHCDDIEIGCGGTLLHLAASRLRLEFHWVVLAAAGPRANEARNGAGLFVGGARTELIFREFRDGFLPYAGSLVKDFFEELKDQVNPDLIFTHWRNDAHQDHRLISELTRNTFRNHLILEYEIPKFDGDLGQPNLFVPLSEMLVRQKTQNLMGVFQSQHAKPWFREETFRSLMRLRGMECNSASGYAEAFYCKKLVL